MTEWVLEDLFFMSPVVLICVGAIILDWRQTRREAKEKK